jgi:hypothetical protein
VRAMESHGIMRGMGSDKDSFRRHTCGIHDSRP